MLQQTDKTPNDFAIHFKREEIEGTKYTFGIYNHNSCLVMSLYDCSLYDYIQTKPLSINKMNTILVTLISILKSIHSKLIIHRDIKPDNIVWNNIDDIKIIDFGLSYIGNYNYYLSEEIKSLDSITIKNQLVKSGLWVSFKTRPFSKTPKLTSLPDGLFVTAMDTNPLALDPNQIINLEKNNFMAGLNVLRSLVSCPIYLCVSEDFNKQEFEKINLQNIDVKACFKSLKGIGSSKMSGINPIQPIIQLNKEDKRFVDHYNIIDEKYIKFNSEHIENLYNLGTHNGKSYYKFTSLESAVSNAVVLSKELYPSLKGNNFIKLSSGFTVSQSVRILLLGLIIYLIYYFIIKKHGKSRNR